MMKKLFSVIALLLVATGAFAQNEATKSGFNVFTNSNVFRLPAGGRFEVTNPTGTTLFKVAADGSVSTGGVSPTNFLRKDLATSQTLTGPVLFPASNMTSVPFSFVGDEDTGVYRQGANVLGFGSGGNRTVEITHPNLNMVSPTGSISIGADTFLARDAADILAQRRGLSAQTFRVYNTYTDASNYERGMLGWDTSVLTLRAESVGTGTVRSLRLIANSVGVGVGTAATASTWDFTSNAHLIPGSTNTRDFGSTTLRVRTGYFGTQVNVSGALGTAPGVAISATGATDFARLSLVAGDGTTSNRNTYISMVASETAPQTWHIGMVGTKAWQVQDGTGSRTPLSVSNTDGSTTFGGQVLAPNGFYNTAPSYSFTSSPTSGWTWLGSGMIGSVNGSAVLSVASGVVAPGSNLGSSLGGGTTRFNGVYANGFHGGARNGTDTAALPTYITADRATGTGTGGDLVFQTAPTGAVSSAVAGALTTRMTIGQDGSTTFGGTVVAANGTAALPSVVFTGELTTGLSWTEPGKLNVSTQGIRYYQLGGTFLDLFGPGIRFSADTILLRDAANILALRNGTNAQNFRVYNTYTDAANYETAELGWFGNEFRVRSTALGAGVSRNLSLVAANTLFFGAGGAKYFEVGMNAIGPLTTNVALLGTPAKKFLGIHLGTTGVVFNDGTTQTTNAAPGSGVTNITDLSFAADSDADGSGVLTLATGGVVRQSISNTGTTTFTSQVTVPEGTSALPGVAVGSAGTGMWRYSTSTLGWSANGSPVLYASVAQLQAISPTLSLSGTLLTAESLHVLALRNGVNPQNFRIYNTYTDASNYERGGMTWNANNFEITSEAAGTGTIRPIHFKVGSTTRFAFDGNAFFLGGALGYTGTVLTSAGAANPQWGLNSATPTAYIHNLAPSSREGIDIDVVGAHAYLRTGNGTGNKGSGNLYVQTAAPGSSSSTKNTMTNRWIFDQWGLLFPALNNIYDFGQSTMRIRSGYFGTKLEVVGALGTGAGLLVSGNTGSDRGIAQVSAGDGTTSSRYAYVSFLANETAPQDWRIGQWGSKSFAVFDATTSKVFLTVAPATGAAQFQSNSIGAAPLLTVAGTGVADRGIISLQAGDGTTSSRQSYIEYKSNETVSQHWRAGMSAGGTGSLNFNIIDTISGRNPVSVSNTDGLVTLANGVNVTGGGGLQVSGAQIQRFTLQIRNNGGVIEHRIVADVSTLGNPSSANKIIGAVNTWTATQNLSPTVGFTAGVGINAGIGDQYILFDVVAQGYFDIIPIAVISGKTTGITTNYIPAVTGTTQNVNGVTRYRTTIVFSAPINTTNIPTTNILSVDLIGFIK